MFLKIQNFQVKYLIIDRKINWEQMYTGLLIFVDNYYKQHFKVQDNILF